MTINEFFAEYLAELLIALFTAVAGFFGAKFKKLIEEKIKSEEKRKIVKDSVKAVEQIYKSLHGTDKLKKAMENASAILCDKGINITELELMTLIESAVCEFNDAFNKASWAEALTVMTTGEEEASCEEYTVKETE